MTSAPPDPKPEPSDEAKSKLTIYPDYCHTLSPTIGKWVPLGVKDVGALRDVGVYCDERKLYHFQNHPIKWVKVTGVVVAMDEFKEKRIYTVDDGSGACVECTAVGAPAATESSTNSDLPRHLRQIAAVEAQVKAEKEKKKNEKEGTGEENSTPSVQNPVVPWGEIDVGMIIKVKGRINSWWGQFQVEAIKMEVLRGLNVEVKSWNEVREFRESVLGKPWVVTQEEEEKCRKIREKELRRARKTGREDRGHRKEGDKSSKEKHRDNEEKREKLRKDVYGTETKKRKDLERVQKLDGSVKKRKDSAGESLGSKNKINYPSLAVRKAAAGKYDALGI